ncbi:molybdate ABC transporter substrate-binding protein [Pelagicoccus enzymogenes]|uniref:molybdate ABC transporter substrate-binding protein n=1 Tax=Pelagicoccus enzymogenes TaxID=2773457 RepID=UPI00280EFB04|nr:molybdate ABC transporter substrate-binding protein [Pelagicoccus enzymogenes]MDQ8196612.1 molybdate ABC transporter substrate-binding protein [Pelagicoccus enzymogenes]
MTRHLLAIAAALAISAPLIGEASLRIAVASNFHQTLSKIAAAYQGEHPEAELVLIPGSSGKLYAQIAKGAAFDAFFSADVERPKKLEELKIAPPETRFTFALGVLAFWQPGSQAAAFSQTQTLARANAQLAPFGAAAAEATERLPFPPHRTVTAVSVAQAFTFAQSGAADSAFVSYSQLRQLGIAEREYILVAPDLHAPIAQQAIALNTRAETLAFLKFCRSPHAQAIIVADGYRIP